MKDSLKPGLESEFRLMVTERQTVPALYPDSDEFRVMPEVFATGYMVGFIELACIHALNPHIDWPREQSVGTGINITHVAATPPGMEVTAKVKLLEVEGRKLLFEVQAFDEVELIGKGTHERFIINAEKFNEKARKKGEKRKP